MTKTTTNKSGTTRLEEMKKDGKAAEIREAIKKAITEETAKIKAEDAKKATVKKTETKKAVTEKATTKKSEKETAPTKKVSKKKTTTKKSEKIPAKTEVVKKPKAPKYKKFSVAEAQARQKYIERLISTGKYTAIQIKEKVCASKKWEGTNPVTVGTIVCHALNPMYSAFEFTAVKDKATKKISFTEKTVKKEKAKLLRKKEKETETTKKPVSKSVKTSKATTKKRGNK